MATYYDSTDLNALDEMSREFYRYKNLYYGGMGVPITNLQYPVEYDASVEDANMEYHITRLYRHTRMNSSYNYFTMGVKRIKVGIKVEEPTTCRYALIRLKCNPMNTRDITTVKADDRLNIETDCWVFLANKGNISGGAITYNYDIVPVADTEVTHRTWELYFADSGIKSLADDIETAGYTDSASGGMQAFDSGSVNNFKRYAGISDNYVTLLNQVRTALGSSNGNIVNANGGSISGFIPRGWGLSNTGASITGITKIPSFIPVWDGRDLDNTEWVSQVANWLLNGVRSGDVDPFSPSYPEKTVIEDYSTNYRVFVTPYEENKSRTKFSIIAYNGDLIQHYDALSEDYHMTVEETTSTSSWKVVQTTPMEMYPTVGFHTLIPQNVLYGFRLTFHNDDNTESGAKFIVTFEYKENSAVHCSVKGVSRDGVTCSRTSIVDGHRYTASTGEWVEILYRTPTIEDLDDSYPNPEDSEDDRTGTDSDFIVGNGLNTFPITGAQFGQINKKLWSTDWTQVFKSSSIDPIRCVIGCKGIPFTATPSSMERIIIANLDTGVDANTCKPVKSFDIGTVAMPSFRGDFSDVTMTRVHLYLPFIGWVDLPSSEVISRVAHADVGITANKKRLGFKYIVDFVDGSCRCVVSVNGSERWYFDGHCDVDIPVTSDNHTQAVGNAIRSGVGAVLSVASAVGGAIAENPMMVATGLVGAISNGANVIPTYNYSASSSPSGYINASMNNHIMIVIEHPNLVMGSNFAHKNGRPCGLTLSLGSLRGYTRCINVDTSGINGTETELSMIKSMLESGVYL